MADSLSRIRRWSLDRQRLSLPADDVLDVLHDVVGVYATQPAGPLALRARMRRFDAREIRAVESNRRAVRVLGMRGIGHFVPRETASDIVTATRRRAGSQAWRLRDAGIDRATYERIRDAVLAATHVPRSTPDLRAALGLAMPLGPILQTMSHEDLLMPVAPESPRSAALLHVSVEAWLGGPLPPVDEGTALRRVIDAYLRGYGPARAEDIQWWLGRHDPAVTAAIAALDLVRLDDGLLLRRDDLAAFEGAPAPVRGRVDLLAMWDVYTMGYQADGRARFVSADTQERLFDTDGNGLGAVLVDGLAAAAWVARTVGRRLEVDLDPFETPSRRLDQALREGFADVARALDLDEATMRVVEGPLGRRLRRRRPGASQDSAEVVRADRATSSERGG